MNKGATMFKKALSPKEFEEEFEVLRKDALKNKTLKMMAAASVRILRDAHEDVYVSVHSS